MLSKIDIYDAFKLLPLSRGVWHLFGIKWKSLFSSPVSRRLTGELIIYPCSVVCHRPSSSSVVVHNFKDLLL